MILAVGIYDLRCRLVWGLTRHQDEDISSSNKQAEDKYNANEGEHPATGFAASTHIFIHFHNSWRRISDAASAIDVPTTVCHPPLCEKNNKTECTTEKHNSNHCLTAAGACGFSGCGQLLVFHAALNTSLRRRFQRHWQTALTGRPSLVRDFRRVWPTPIKTTPFMKPPRCAPWLRHCPA